MKSSLTNTLIPFLLLVSRTHGFVEEFPSPKIPAISSPKPNTLSSENLWKQSPPTPITTPPSPTAQPKKLRTATHRRKWGVEKPSPEYWFGQRIHRSETQGFVEEHPSPKRPATSSPELKTISSENYRVSQSVTSLAKPILIRPGLLDAPLFSTNGGAWARIRPLGNRCGRKIFPEVFGGYGRKLR